LKIQSAIWFLILLLWLLDFSHFEKLLVFGTLEEGVESLFASHIARLGAEMVAIATNASDNTCALDALGEASDDAWSIFVMVSLNFYVYHCWGRIPHPSKKAKLHGHRNQTGHLSVPC
jgi:hypothetical protein